MCFTLCTLYIVIILIDYSFWFDTNQLVTVHCTYLGVSGYNFKKNIVFFVRSFLTFTNNADPDEMQHFAAFYLGLHCLQKYSFKGLTFHLNNGGSNISDYVLLNLLKELRKRDKIRGLPSILFLFCNAFNKSKRQVFM